MFFRNMKAKARSEGYSQGYRDATKDAILFWLQDQKLLIKLLDDPTYAQEMLRRDREHKWALLDAQRKAKK